MMFRDNDHGVFMDTAWCWKIKVIILLALMKLLLILKYVHAPPNWEHNRVTPIKITSIRQSSGKCDGIFGQVAESLSMYRVVPLSSSAAVCECPWQPQASTAILHSQCISPHPKKKRTNWLLQCRQSPAEQKLLGLLIQPSTFKSCSGSCPCGGWGSLTAHIQLSG